jgi:hypothetical protein
MPVWLTSLRPLRFLLVGSVALGLLDILLQFAPDVGCAGVSFVGGPLEAFKFSSRPTKP